MKYVKSFRRIGFSLAILTVLMLCSLLIFLETGSSVYLSDETKRMITFEVRSSPKLPPNFLGFYNKVFPKSLEKGVWNWVFSKFSTNMKNTECPCATLAYNPMLYNRHSDGIGSVVARLTVALQFEEIYSQTECLNYLTHSYDFLRNIRGIQAASKFYLNKAIEDLNESEMAELIARMENPSLYDREKNLWNLNRKINLILGEINSSP